MDEILIPICGESDIVVARHEGRALAVQLGFSTSDQVLVTTAISEVARNIIQYADHGRMTMSIVEEQDRRGIRIVAQDEGPGIQDVDLAMMDGYSTGGGLGLGLPGSRRLMDEFELWTQVGKGTRITMTKWAR